MGFLNKLKILFFKPEIKIEIKKVGHVCATEIEVNKSIKNLTKDDLRKICEAIKESTND